MKRMHFRGIVRIRCCDSPVSPTTKRAAFIQLFTVDNETAFTKSWTAELPMTKNENPMFEYACHEGNYSLMNVLAGARSEENAPKP